MVFEVAHGEWKGPLEVLLDLIEARKLHISDVALSKVTGDFLQYLKGLQEFPLAESAHFTYVAATLLLIKSKSLLPQLSLSPEEEESIEDLERRLKLLQRFRELARHVRGRFGQTPMFLPQERAVAPVFAPPKEIRASTVLSAIRAVLAAIPKAEALVKVAVGKIITLEEMIERLKNRIQSALRMSFKEFSGLHKGERVNPNNSFEDERRERVNVIVGFLAMLELVKQGLIHATQEKAHGDIVMETGSVEVPRYN